MLFEDHARILFIGDSIGDYGRERPFGDSPDGWGQSYISLIASLLQSTYPEKQMRFCNVCTDGNQTRDLAARWDSDVLAWNPTWVCVMIGINDVWRRYDCPDHPEMAVPLDEYEATLEKLIEKTLPKVKGMILLTPYFMLQCKEDPMRRDMDRYGEAVKKLGQKYNLLTIDTQAVWDAFFEKSGMHPHGIQWDCIHPNLPGRAVLARAFLKAVEYEW